MHRAHFGRAHFFLLQNRIMAFNSVFIYMLSLVKYVLCFRGIKLQFMLHLKTHVSEEVFIIQIRWSLGVDYLDIRGVSRNNPQFCILRPPISFNLYEARSYLFILNIKSMQAFCSLLIFSAEKEVARNTISQYTKRLKCHRILQLFHKRKPEWVFLEERKYLAMSFRNRHKSTY